MAKEWYKQNPSKKSFLMKDNNIVAKMYKPKYITLKTKIPNNEPN